MGDIKHLVLPERMLVRDWGKLAWDVFQYQYFDAIVIRAPLDTIPWLGMALSLMLKNFSRPILLYGRPEQDGLAEAWARHCSGGGVFALGNATLLLACRTTYSLREGLTSPSYPPIGSLENGTFCFYRKAEQSSRRSDAAMVCDAINENIGLVMPGYAFAQEGKLLERSAYLVMLDSTANCDWLFDGQRKVLDRLRRAQIPVVVCGLPSRIEEPMLRRRLLRSGVISAGSMTAEAAAVKLMWTMARTGTPKGVRLYFNLSFAGENDGDGYPFP